MNCNPAHPSTRELEVIKARALGHAYKQIASDLGISINTVKTHLRRVFLKLDVQCSLELLQRMEAHECSNCPFSRPHNTADRRTLRLNRVLA